MGLKNTGLILPAEEILSEFDNCTWPETFHTIVFHKKPHIEEYGALVYLREFGESTFPGIKDAKIEYWEAGTSTPDGRSWKAWFADGYLPVGVGGSPFDEHANKARGRITGHCAASLVAIALEIDKEPWNTKMLRYLTINDTQGGHSPFELAGMTELLNEEFFETEPERNVIIITTFICAFLRKQQRFFGPAKVEYEKNVRVYPCLHQGRTITLASITNSDNDLVATYARSKHGADADVVVTKNMGGNIYISTQGKSNIDLDEVMKLIRFEEMKVNKKIPTISEEELKKEGEITGSELWYYDKQATRIFNGSKRKVQVPTKIPFWKLMDLVKEGLEKSAVHKQDTRIESQAMRTRQIA